MVIYRSRLNAKINRNFEVFTATDFLAAITQHIPDKGAQMVRYYGWYSPESRRFSRISWPLAPGHPPKLLRWANSTRKSAKTTARTGCRHPPPALITWVRNIGLPGQSGPSMDGWATRTDMRT
jgi:hypothetical protein